MDFDDEEISINGWIKIKNLGSGGFGVVTLWENPIENKKIAIKMCLDDSKQSVSNKQRDRWIKEVENLQKLSHPNLVQVLPLPDELSELSSSPILCMEYCTLGDLRKVLHKPENCCGLPEDEIRSIIHDIKGAIQYLHSNKIIHRDLKPENIVLQSSDYSKIIYKLIDLGFAKDIDKNSLCASLVGTLQYLAPELFTQNYTYSVDYWSFGLVCHEIITGMRPFLPNMHPVDWMKIVQKKNPDDICIYEDSNGEINFRQEIFPENHISQPFKYDMEKWLCLALEWDGTKRGKSYDNRLILFSTLDVILKKKIVTVFSTAVFCKFGYEIDESTVIKTLKKWLHRDTKQPINSQIILLPSGESLSDQDLVHNHWNPDLAAMLYVFPEEGLSLPSTPPKPPLLVSKMLESPKMKQKYHISKRAWSNGVYFLQQLLVSYQMFLEAYAVKMLSILSNHRIINNLEQETGNEFLQVFAKYNFCVLSTQNDLKFLNKINFNNSEAVLLSKWNNSVKELNEKFNNLTELSKRLNTTIGATLKKISDLQNIEEPGQLYIEELSKLVSLGFNVYTKFRQKTNKERMLQYDYVDMYKIVFLSLKLCSKIFKDKPFINHLNDLNKCDQIIKCLIPSIKSFKQHIMKFNQDLSDFQYQRQSNVWEIIYNLKRVPDSYNLFKPNEIVGSTSFIPSSPPFFQGSSTAASPYVDGRIKMNSSSFQNSINQPLTKLNQRNSDNDETIVIKSDEDISKVLSELGIESDDFLIDSQSTNNNCN